MRLMKLFWLGTVFVFFVVAASKTGSVGLAQAGCTVTVKPDESIQKAIDAAQEGAVVCLATGTWEENVEINRKNLTLRGAGQEQTVLKAKKVNKPVVEINGDSPNLVVFVESLAAMEAGDSASVFIRGKIRVVLKQLRLLKSLYGLIAGDSVHVNLSECELSSNGIGLWVEYGQVDIMDCRISLSKSTGIIVAETSVLNMTNSRVFENGLDGLFIGSFSNVKVVNSQIYKNQGWAGVSVGGALPEVAVVNSQIYANEGSGLQVKGSSTVTLQGSSIMGNGTSHYCFSPDFLCSGLEVEDESEVALVDSIIAANTDWGINAPLRQCGYPEDFFFAATVYFKVQNFIQGNNISGNLNGLGNPGNHPWNRPDVPDGQVCLP